MKKKTKEKKEHIEKVPAILKLKEIFSKGYLPSRGNQSYTAICPNTEKSYANQVNCFAHACLNLTNEQLDKLNFSNYDTFWFDIKSYSYEPDEYVAKNFMKIMKRIGLEVEKCNKKASPKNDNQWKVALYFGYTKFLDSDYHFIKQEQDGSWTSKVGWENKVDHFEQLPKIINSPTGTEYKLFGTYIITNPHKATQLDEINEKV